jgi:hypothetical protein
MRRDSVLRISDLVPDATSRGPFRPQRIARGGSLAGEAAKTALAANVSRKSSSSVPFFTALLRRLEMRLATSGLASAL